MTVKNTWVDGETYTASDQNTIATQVNQNATDIASLGTSKQAADSELSAIAGLTLAADRLSYLTGLGTPALATFTSAGRAMDGYADATA